MSEENNGPMEPEKLEARCAADAKKVRRLLEDTAAYCVKVGNIFLLIAPILKGEQRFTRWLQEDCHVSVATAYNLMRVAHHFGEFVTVTKRIEQTGLYALARKSVSDKTRLAVMKESEQRYLTTKDVRALIARHEGSDSDSEANEAEPSADTTPAQETSAPETETDAAGPDLNEPAIESFLDAFFLTLFKFLETDEIDAVLSPLAGHAVDELIAYFYRNQKALRRRAGYGDDLPDDAA